MPPNVPVCESCRKLLPADSDGASCAECLPSSRPDTVDLFGERFSSRSSPPELSRPPSRDPVGSFGKYDLEEEIGRGGMAIVYRARQRDLNRPVAIKMLRPEVLPDSDRLQRLRLEAEIIAGLTHPHIISIYEIGEENGQVYFSMPFISGNDFAALGKISSTRAASYIERVARAVHYAHQCGVLHRDLKPSNILLDEKDEPRVVDFGIAKLLEGREDLKQTRGMMGTPAYMAPEQVHPSGGPVSTAVDIHALGAVLYYLLTGRAPFEGGRHAQVLWAVYYDEPLPPAELVPGVPRDLQTICLTCLAKHPGKRYASALALAEDLKRFMDGEPISARPIGWAERLWRWNSRNPFLGALGVSLVAAICWGLWAHHQALNEARRARMDAEGLIEFMNQDLAGKLRPLGRMDLLKDIFEQVAAYYTTDSQPSKVHPSSERKAMFHRNAVLIHLDLGDLDAARQHGMDGLAMAEKQIRSRGGTVEWRRMEAEFHLGLHRTARATTDLGSAQAHLWSALASGEKLRTLDPSSAENSSILFAEILMSGASWSLSRADLLQADDYLERASVLLEYEAVKRPGAREVRYLLAQRHYHRGIAHQMGKRSAAARDEFECFLRELREMVEADGADQHIKHELAMAHNRVGEALYELGESELALLQMKQFHHLSKRLSELDPSNVLWKYALGQSLCWLGVLELERSREGDAGGGYLVQAVAAYGTIFLVNPNLDEWYGRLDEVRTRLAQWHEARFELSEARVLLDENLGQSWDRVVQKPANRFRQEALSRALRSLAAFIQRHEDSAAAMDFVRFWMGAIPARAQASPQGLWNGPLSDLHLLWANLSRQEGNFDLALAASRRALEDAPATGGDHSGPGSERRRPEDCRLDRRASIGRKGFFLRPTGNQ